MAEGHVHDAFLPLVGHVVDAQEVLDGVVVLHHHRVPAEGPVRVEELGRQDVLPMAQRYFLF